jgi:chemotaxis protein MotB
MMTENGKFLTARPLWLGLCLMLVGIASTGCTTPTAYRQAIEDRDGEIRSLREERTRLKRERLAAQDELNALEARLMDANSALDDISARPITPIAAFPDLDAHGVGYGMRNGDLVITIPSSISFGSGKAELSREGREALKAVASTLNGQFLDGFYHVEGHTDDDPIKKSKFASNRELSLARAMAVLNYLVEECSVLDDQCVVVGHGQYNPLVSNDTKAHKAENRRVEIIVRS